MSFLKTHLKTHLKNSILLVKAKLIKEYDPPFLTDLFDWFSCVFYMNPDVF